MKRQALAEFASQGIRLGPNNVTAVFRDQEGDVSESDHFVIFDVNEDAILLNVGFDAQQPMIPSPITVYGFDGLGQGYTFRSKLSGVRWRDTSGGKKVKVWVVDRPQSVERKQRRSAFRLDVTIPAKLTCGQEEEKLTLSATIVDISFTGCRLHIDPGRKAHGRTGGDWRGAVQANREARLSLWPPPDFLPKERPHLPPRRRTRAHDIPKPDASSYRTCFSDIPVKIVSAGAVTDRRKEPLFVVAAGFRESKGVNQLVRFLERQAIQLLKH